MKWYRALVMALVLAPAAMMGPLTEKVSCSGGSCGFTINESGFATSTIPTSSCVWNDPNSPCPYTDAFNKAQQDATNRLESGCSAASCQANGCGGDATGLTSAGYGWDTPSGIGVYAELGPASGGGHYAYVYKHARCNCAPTCEEEGTCPVNQGPKVGVSPYTSPIFSPIQSFFKRLFGKRIGG